MIIHVTATPGRDPHQGRLQTPSRQFECALGRTGLRTDKTEGDGATPIGRFPFRRLLFRADRRARPKTGLPVRPLVPGLGWCDDTASPAYNRLVRLPCPWRHEKLWRQDALYDLIVVLGHNDAPPVASLGSAIFLHVAGPDLAPTEGCVALPWDDLVELLAQLSPGDEIAIGI